MTKTAKYLEFEINSESTNYFIMLNNVKVFSEIEKSPIKQFLPVNEWILKNKNVIHIYVDVDSNANPADVAKSTKLTVTLFLREVIDGKENKYIISNFDLSPSAEKTDTLASNSLSNIKLNSNNRYEQSEVGDVIVGEIINTPVEGWTNFKQEIIIDIDLPEWAFVSSDFIGDDQNMSDAEYYGLIDELHAELVNIWNLMKQQNTKDILKLTELRSSEFDNAYHLSKGNKQKDMESSLESAFNHKDLFLDDLIKKDQSQLSIEANGKIASLRLAGTNQEMLFYSHKNDAFTRFYHFYFMKKDGKWIIIR